VAPELRHRRQDVLLYIADEEGSVREHAQRGGFPADSVVEVHTIVDPTTAEVRATA